MRSLTLFILFAIIMFANTTLDAQRGRSGDMGDGDGRGGGGGHLTMCLEENRYSFTILGNESRDITITDIRVGLEDPNNPGSILWSEVSNMEINTVPLGEVPQANDDYVTLPHLLPKSEFESVPTIDGYLHHRFYVGVYFQNDLLHYYPTASYGGGNDTIEVHLKVDYSLNAGDPLTLTSTESTLLRSSCHPRGCNRLVRNGTFDTSFAPDVDDFCNEYVYDWSASHGRPKLIENGGISGNAAKLRVQKMTDSQAANNEALGQGIKTDVYATSGNYLFSMYKKTLNGSNKTRVILGTDEEGSRANSPQDHFWTAGGCALENQAVQNTNGAVTIFETPNVWDEPEFRRYIGRVEVPEGLLGAAPDYESLFIYPSATGNSNNAANIQVAHVNLVKDYFVSGGRSYDIKTCVNTFTLGREHLYSLNNIKYTWTNLSTGEILVENSSSPLLVLSNELGTHHYRLSRTFSSINDAYETQIYGGALVAMDYAITFRCDDGPTFPVNRGIVENHSSIKMDIEISPNPSRGILDIALDLNTEEDLMVGLYDLNGQWVRDITGAKSASRLEVTTDISDLPNGIYFIRVVGKESLHTEKVILSK